MVALSSLLAFFLLVTSSRAQLLKGQQCQTSSGDNGFCESVSSCKGALEEIRQNVRPTICSFEEKTPIVCCVDLRQPEYRAKKMCEEYKNLGMRHVQHAPPFSDSSNGKVNLPDGGFGIIGGTFTLEKAYPHMAAIGFGEEDNISWLCGGSLISEQYVMTAAHCVSAGSRGLARWVLLGVIELTSVKKSSSAQLFSVVEHIRHPDFKHYSHYNDIALLKLDHPAVFNDYVKPACLQVRYSTETGVLVAAGWGLVDWADEKGSNYLMNVALPLISSFECNQTHKSLVGSRKLMFGIQDDKMLCAGESSGGKDTCGGDSGGPLQYSFGLQNNIMHYVVGITSFGTTVCGSRNSPAVYTRVSYYVPWIENIVWP